MLEPMSCGLPFPTECVMANVWSGGLGLLLVLSSQWGALAQSSNEDLRKRYIGCAALFGAVSTMVPDGKAKDNLATASILLLTWASEVNVGQPAKKGVDQIMRELERRMTELAPDIKVGAPTAAKDFGAKHGGELKSCQSLYFAELKKRKGQ